MPHGQQHEERTISDRKPPFSTGSGGVDVDLIQAHKWFNLAALGGNREGQLCRADVSAEMSRDEIAEAQRQARAWLDETAQRPVAQRYAA
jgi:uncharacterized protein